LINIFTISFADNKDAKKLKDKNKDYFENILSKQFNKDINMISKQYLFDFIEDNDKQPNPSQLSQIQIRAEKDALALSVLKFVSSLTLPQQPKMRTAISFYQDRFNEAIKQDPINGAEEFMKDNPEYFMLADKLTNNLSGIRSDETAVALLQRNNLAVREIVTNVKDLSALGAIFNDDNYAFSSSADAYLRTQKIPGLDAKYKSSEASLENMKSTIVNKGWTDWFKLIQVVSTEMKKPPYNLDPARGYGDVVLQQYKDAFIEQQKTENPMWYENGTLDLRGNLVSSFTGYGGTTAAGASWSMTINQALFEFETSYMVDAVGFYAPGGVNIQAWATGIIHFMSDGSTNGNNYASITSNGISISLSSTNAGVYTVTFTNTAGSSMSNNNARIIKLNRMN
jgi:hypothetical protein